MNTKSRVKLKISGHVQGVFFRISTRKLAVKLGLTGWVKNNNDGSVDCLAEGDKSKLEELVDWCKQGFDYAQVEKIEVGWEEYVGEFNNFEIKY